VRDAVFTYARDNIVVVKVFARDPYYTLIERDIKMTLISFVGNTGGLVGLCLGFSFVSLVEIIFHLGVASVRLCRSCGSKQDVAQVDVWKA